MIGYGHDVKIYQLEVISWFLENDKGMASILQADTAYVLQLLNIIHVDPGNMFTKIL
jgi:hypothetical protein